MNRILTQRYTIYALHCYATLLLLRYATLLLLQLATVFATTSTSAACYTLCYKFSASSATSLLLARSHYVILGSLPSFRISTAIHPRCHLPISLPADPPTPSQTSFPSPDPPLLSPAVSPHPKPHSPATPTGLLGVTRLADNVMCSSVN